MQFGKLYPRMYLGATAGIIDGKHHKRLGKAWMLFFWCVTRQTGQGAEGIVCRGAVVTYEEIADEMNCPRGSVREWMRRLVREKYIRTERERRGIRIFVLNPKKFKKSPVSDADVIRTNETPRASKRRHSEPVVIVENPASEGVESRHSNPIHAAENADTSENLLQKNLTKHLGNNNTNAAAKTASVTIPSLKSLAKTKSVPREKTSFEVDARRRQLLTQAEAMKKKYPGGNCGIPATGTR